MPDLPRARWGKPWFHPKFVGWGASLPCSWEGWAAFAGFFFVIMGWSVAVRRIAPANEAIAAALLAGGFFIPVIALIVVAWGRASGGWRWRWGPRSK